MRFRAKAALLSSAILLAGSAGAVEPFSFDAAPGRLPKEVVPTDYSVSVTPDLDAHTVQGSEAVTLTVRKPVSSITFNSLNQRLDHVTLDGQPVKSVESDDTKQLTEVTLAAPIKPGTHKLAFTYTGKIESNPFGLYTQSYKTPDGREGRLLSTKFEATDARRMFPCWDEPAFRATFQLSLTGPASWAAISNMPVARKLIKGEQATVMFQRTPKMPTYLVELTAGDFAEIHADAGKTRLGIWAIKGQEQGGREALENAKTILADYNDYFGYLFPLPKLDSIATPGGFTGAMENWGAITYNDQILLITPASTLINRQSVFAVQAHEMAHQWNGDLVTMGWWDDLWLNESFASWRGAKETEARHPEWKWWERQDARKEEAMTADARITSHAIEQHVTNELEARSAFDRLITYSKGQAVLRMLEAYIGEDRFRDGIRAYMKARAYSNATSADLWLALDATGGGKVSEVAASWTGQPGYPLITAAASCDASGNRTLTLSQARFLLRGEDSSGQVWRVPLLLRSGTGEPRSVLLSEARQSLEAGRCDEPLSLDAGAVGYFRIAYDDATLETDRKAFAALPSGDRIALLDDQWALVESGRQPIGHYLPLAEALGEQVQERAWSQILDALAVLEKDERGTPGHDAFVAYAVKLLKPVAGHLGWQAAEGETPATQDLRRRLLGQLGMWGDAATLAEARRLFERFAADPSSLPPDDQGFVLNIVGAYADQATFDRLHAIAKSAHSETELRRYLAAMAQTQDAALAKQVADIALSGEIPAQAGAVRFQLISTLADHHPVLAWAVFAAHVDQLMEAYPQYRPVILAQSVPEIFWAAQTPEEAEAWLKTHIPEAMLPNLARGVEAARFLRSEKEMLLPQADAYVGGHS